MFPVGQATLIYTSVFVSKSGPIPGLYMDCIWDPCCTLLEACRLGQRDILLLQSFQRTPELSYRPNKNVEVSIFFMNNFLF